MKQLLLLAIITAFSATLVLGEVTPDTKATRKNAKLEQEIVRICTDWDNSYIQRDMPALKRILADDFIGIDDTGSVTKKEDEIALTQSGDFVISSVVRDEPLKVRTYRNTVVVTGCSTVKQQVKGKDATGQFRFTIVLIRQGESWKIVSWQGTKVKKD
jgi:ketosteroid isomerase-like protein